MRMRAAVVFVAVALLAGPAGAGLVLYATPGAQGYYAHPADFLAAAGDLIVYAPPSPPPTAIRIATVETGPESAAVRVTSGGVPKLYTLGPSLIPYRARTIEFDFAARGHSATAFGASAQSEFSGWSLTAFGADGAAIRGQLGDPAGLGPSSGGAGFLGVVATGGTRILRVVVELPVLMFGLAPDGTEEPTLAASGSINGGPVFAAQPLPAPEPATWALAAAGLAAAGLGRWLGRRSRGSA